MPELPEVETVRRGLERLIGCEATLHRLQPQRADLRAPIPSILKRKLRDTPILGVRRRAKYLLLDTKAGILLSHLGMTGTWRLAPPGDERDHDHCYLILGDGRRLAFRDPRRFGLLDYIATGAESTNSRLAALGPEPLDPGAFTATYLHNRCRNRRSAIKTVIMDQANVVGVGNIYAQEALFRVGIRPTRPAGRLSIAECAALVDSIRLILRDAIKAGGSTINDFRQAGGDSGYFQHNFQVYDRAGEPCPRCHMQLHGAVVGGRGTTWCKSCQR